MNTITRITSLVLISLISLTMTLSAGNTNSTEAEANFEASTSFETSSKAAFVSDAVCSPTAPTKLVFFLDKAEYYTVTIMDEFNNVVINKEINGKKGLNSFLLDFAVGAKDQYTFSVYGENGVDFSGNIPHS